MIGIIKEIRITGDQHVAVIETGAGPAVTATVMQPGNMDFCPMPGDAVLYHENGREIVISAISAQNASTGLGETLIFARDATGQVSASVHLKATGQVVISHGEGQTVVAGTGSDSVAMSTKVQTLWTCLLTALKAWQEPKPPDGGVALAAALVTAFTSAALDPPNVASKNLKAD